jgi:hypothetical protein
MGTLAHRHAYRPLLSNDKRGTDTAESDIISLKYYGGYKDRWTDADRQQGDLINLLIFFQNKESRLKIGDHKQLMMWISIG